jgi:hypothetical protein
LARNITYVRTVGVESTLSARDRPKFCCRFAALTNASALGRSARMRGPRSSPAPGIACAQRPAATSAHSDAATNGRRLRWSFSEQESMLRIAGLLRYGY